MTHSFHAAASAQSNARARSCLVLLDYAASLGIAAEEALAGTDLRVDTLDHPDAEATAVAEMRLITNIVATHPGPTAGLAAGARYRLTTYGVWGFALISSPTVAAAAEVGMRYVDLVSGLTAPVYEVEGTDLVMVLGEPEAAPEVARFIVQRDMTFAQSMLRDIAGPEATFAEVTIRHDAAESEITAYVETFGRRPVFGAARNTLVLDPALLSAELPQADRFTLEIAQAQCREMLDRQQARAGTAGQVRDAIVASLRHPPSTAEVAEFLHLSERTLRRRLAAEGTSLRALVDEVRSTLAAELVRSGSLTVAEIADRLGYVEQSSFSQAFRRWHGVSPRAYAAAARS